ncbi:hypothetical protein D3C74_136460 [compost metagenome]
MRGFISNFKYEKGTKTGWSYVDILVSVSYIQRGFFVMIAHNEIKVLGREYYYMCQQANQFLEEVKRGNIASYIRQTEVVVEILYRSLVL